MTEALYKVNLGNLKLNSAGIKFVIEGFFKEMRPNLAVFTVFTAIILSFLCSSVWAINPGPIDSVRSKEVLSSADFEVIEAFWGDLTGEMLDIVDFTQIARLRAIAVTRQSDQAQFNEQYIKFARKYLGEALQKSGTIEDTKKRHQVRLNLAILIAQLENPRLIDLAIGILNDDDQAVRYWSVKALTKSGMISQIEKSESMMTRVITAMGNIIGTVEPKTLNMIVDFTASANSDLTEPLLLKIADMRIAGYEADSLEGFLVDGRILKILCSDLETKRNKADEVGPRFGQLYSYTVQKYIKVLSAPDSLSEDRKRQLASVVVDIEDKCIGELTGLVQTVIKRSVENDDANVLLLQHDRLLGNDEKKGEIPSKFGFNYGRAADGSAIQQPKKLP